MGEQENTERKDLGFLHKVCDGINHTSLTYWLQNDEFYDEISDLVDNGIRINKSIVFESMRRIYLKYENNDDGSLSDPDFHFYLARRGIESLWSAMTGSRTGWRECDDSERIKTEKYLGFLHKVCEDNNHTSLSYWMCDNDFHDEISRIANDGVRINKEIVFDTMKRLYFEKEEKRNNASECESDFDFSLARKIINELSEQITGDRFGWGYTPKDKYPVKIPDGYEDMNDILRVIEPMPKSVQRSICDERTLSFLRDKKYNSLDDLFFSIRDLFYTMVLKGARMNNDKEKNISYYRVRGIMEWFSERYHGDKNWWREDYENYLNQNK